MFCAKTVQVTTGQALLQLQHSRTVQLGDNPIYLIMVETLHGANVGENMWVESYNCFSAVPVQFTIFSGFLLLFTHCYTLHSLTTLEDKTPEFQYFNQVSECSVQCV